MAVNFRLQKGVLVCRSGHKAALFSVLQAVASLIAAMWYRMMVLLKGYR
jgi:hypothetical protein